MTEKVKHIALSPNNPSGTDWQILGELKLPIGSNVNGTINPWLRKSLDPLNLHDDFLRKILKSVGEAAERAMKSDVAEATFEYLHILVFVPAGHPKGQTWGFFRVERTDTVTKTKNPNRYVIEYYLYQDGRS